MEQGLGTKSNLVAISNPTAQTVVPKHHLPLKEPGSTGRLRVWAASVKGGPGKSYTRWDGGIEYHLGSCQKNSGTSFKKLLLGQDGKFDHQ